MFAGAAPAARVAAASPPAVAAAALSIAAAAQAAFPVAPTIAAAALAAASGPARYTGVPTAGQPNQEEKPIFWMKKLSPICRIYAGRMEYLPPDTKDEIRILILIL